MLYCFQKTLQDFTCSGAGSGIKLEASLVTRNASGDPASERIVKAIEEKGMRTIIYNLRSIETGACFTNHTYLTCNVTDKKGTLKSHHIDFKWVYFHHFPTNLLHFGTSKTYWLKTYGNWHQYKNLKMS